MKHVQRETLPAEVTTYVGRRTEIREISRLLGSASLVTLIGPGGVGKTRLALRAATEAQESFDGDVVYVSLAELHEPGLLVNTVANHLDLGERSARPPIELLVDRLRTRRLLLVLDNCEHLLDACAQLAETLLASCPGVVTLATSRQSLGVEGEQVLPVPPLAVPTPGETSSAIAGYDAVRLFAERARAVLPSFAVTEDNVADVIRLCRALDGLPLAIELAAVRLRSLSVRQLAERLEKRFTLLNSGRRRGPSRHANFQALIDWSHELCTDQERLMWARVSVFSGSFDLESAEQVCTGDGLDRDAVLDVLDALIDKSILLREEDHGIVRYRLLEPVRQYGQERLDESGDLVDRRRRHRDWYLELVARFEAAWFGSEQLEWVGRLKREHANLRSALDFCTSSPNEAIVGLRMVPAFKEYLVIRGLYAEGRVWLSKLLDSAPDDVPYRVDALWVTGFLALVQSDEPAYERAVAQAEIEADYLGDERARAYVHHVRGYAALIGNDGETAAKLFRTAADAFQALQEDASEMWATYNYGLAISLAGDLERGREVLQDCIATCVARGELFWRCWALWSRSAAEYLYGDVEQSVRAGAELLSLQRGFSDPTLVAFSLTVLAGCETHLGRLNRAARMFGAATAVWQAVGASPTRYGAFIEPMHRDIEIVTNGLGEETAIEEFAAGTTMSISEAVDYALAEEPAEAAGGKCPEPVPDALDPLTKRETEIAVLVAEGLTNRLIAERLVIARRTAETHVDHIMTKLGFSTRAQIAAWVVARRPSS